MRLQPSLLSPALLRGEENAKEFTPIAIVGYAGRFPGARNPAELWELMESNGSGLSDVPATRWNADQWYNADPRSPAKMIVRRGGFIEDVENFDANFFGVSPREARRMDPQQRILLEVAWQAFESGRLSHCARSSNTGVFVGVSACDYAKRFQRTPVYWEQLDPYCGTGSAHAIVANRISYVLDLGGPSVALDTACSSALVAVHLAARSLQANECEMALAGGANLLLVPDASIAFSKAMMLSPDGECFTFDSRANGYVRSEAVGLVLLKRLDDALKAGDPIRAVILGTSVNQDGRSVGISAPRKEAQIACIKSAMVSANLQPDDFGYIEAHGTGTRLGDLTELSALSEVFTHSKDSLAPCYVGSIKATIGHAETASGIASLIRLSMMLERETLLKQHNFERLNPHVDLASSRLVIPLQNSHWPTIGSRRLAGINSFGFGGTNAHAIVSQWVCKSATIVRGWEAECAGLRQSQDCSAARSAGFQERGPTFFPFVLSAHSESALRAYAGAFCGEIARHPEWRIEDICLTTTGRLARHRFCIAKAFQSVASLVSELTKFAQAKDSLFNIRQYERRGSALAFLLSGQGSQYPGMGKELFESCPVFREAVLECAHALSPKRCPNNDDAGLEVVRWLTDDSIGESINETNVAQPALFAYEFAMCRFWQSCGIVPEAVLGHSVGEYVAACIAGVYKPEQMIKILARRGSLMQQSPPGQMAAVAIDEFALMEIIEQAAPSVVIAACNAPNSCVISGTADEIQRMQQACEQEKIKFQLLRVSRAFHSPLLDEVLKDFDGVLEGCDSRPPEIPMLSNLFGNWHSQETTFNASYWAMHAREPVLFQDCCQRLVDLADSVLEVGPTPTLLPLLLENSPSNREQCFYSTRRDQDVWESLVNAGMGLELNGLRIDWSAFSRNVAWSPIELPGYPFAQQRYWLVHPNQVETIRAVSSNFDFANTHPLLGNRLPTPVPQLQFQSLLSSASCPFLQDHLLGGEIVMPAVAYVEMALAGNAQVNPEFPVRIENLEVSNPLSIHDEMPILLQTTLEPRATGWQMSITSLSDIQNGGSVQIDKDAIQHATARIVPSGAATAQLSRSSIEDIESHRSQVLNHDEIYDLLKRHGFAYGRSFRLLDQYHRKRNDFCARSGDLARMQVRPSWAEFHFHPAILDGAAQAIGLTAALAEGQSYQLAAPVGIRALQVYDRVGSAFTIYGTMQRISDVRFEANGRICREDGTLVAEFEGFAFELLTRAPKSESVFHSVKWSQKSNSINTWHDPAIISKQRWIVVGRESVVSTKLIERLQDLDAFGSYVSMELDICGLSNGDSRPSESTGQLIKAIQRSQREQSGIIFMGLTGHPPERFSSNPVEKDPAVSPYGALLSTIQAALTATSESGKHNQLFRLLVVTQGGQLVSAEDALEDIGASCTQDAIAQAALWGVTRVLANESHQFSTRLLDLDPADESDVAVEVLLAELCGWDDEEQVAYRGGYRWTPRLVADVSKWQGLDVTWTEACHWAGPSHIRAVDTLTSKSEVSHNLTSTTTVQSALPSEQGPFRSIQYLSETWSGYLDSSIRFDSIVAGHIATEVKHFVGSVDCAHMTSEASSESTESPLEVGACTYTGEIRLQRSPRRTLDDLRYVKVPVQELGDHDVEIDTRSAALNFSDVLKAMGIYPSSTELPLGLGIECAGMIRRVGADVQRFKVGDRVMAICDNAIASSVITDERALLHMPDSWSFDQASTVPIAFLTAHYSLCHLARLSAGERVLIHSAAGGVGLAAIQIAQRVGAEVWATAGSVAKREYLASRGIEHVFDSRSLEFADQILAKTSQRGVDVVLNSLAGSAIGRGLECLSAGGRFLELGKADIYQDRSLGMSPFRNNLSFFAIDLDKILRESSGLVRDLFGELERMFQSSIYSYLPFSSFNWNEAKRAFRHLAGRQSIGKVLIDLASREPTTSAEASTNYGEQCVWITGGTGGLGLKVAEWLIEQGTRKLVLLCRRSPNPLVRNQLDQMRLKGAHIHCHVQDISELTVEEIRWESVPQSLRNPSLLVHTAGILEDGLLSDQTPERYQRVFDSKVRLWMKLAISLPSNSNRCHLLFSSVAGVLGSPGQGPYAAANAALDRCATRLGKFGRVCVIDWGPWASVGMAARTSHLRPQNDGWVALKLSEGLAAMGQAIEKGFSSSFIAKVDWTKALSMSRRVPSLCRNLVENHSTQQDPAEIRERLLSLTLPKRQKELERHIVSMLANALGIKPTEVSASDSLRELGVDSLMVFQLRNEIECHLRVRLPVSKLLENPTITKLAKLTLDSMFDASLAPDKQDEEIVATVHSRKTFGLSKSQEPIWFMEHVSRNAANLHKQCSLTLVRQKISDEEIRRCFQTLQERHAAFRTGFKLRHGFPEQVIVDESQIEQSLLFIDARDWTEGQVKQRMQEHATSCIELDEPPLMRVVVFRHSASQFYLGLMIHHLIADTQSRIVCMSELSRLFKGEELPALTAGTAFQDFVHWQRQLLNGARGEQLREFWRSRKLENYSKLGFASSARSEHTEVYTGASISSRIDRRTSFLLMRLAKRLKTSVASVLLTAFQVALSRYAGQRQFLTGVAAHGRTHSNFASTVGQFVNVIPVRSCVDETLSFAEITLKVQQELAEVLANQDVPLAAISEMLQTDTATDLSSLCKTLFLMQEPLGVEYKSYSASLITDPTSEYVSIHSRFCPVALELVQAYEPFDITLECGTTGREFVVVLHYNSSMFDQAFANSFMSQLIVILDQAVEDASGKKMHLNRLPVQKTALEEGSNPENAELVEEAISTDLLESISRFVEQTPNSIAIATSEIALTYAEVWARTARIAQVIRESCVMPGACVAIWLDRSENLSLAILGILAAGKAFLPLDPRHPVERNVTIMRHARVGCVLTSKNCTLPFHSHVRPVFIEDCLTIPSEDTVADFEFETPVASEPAYVIYTSGSTGCPNGVEISRGSLNWFMKVMPRAIQMDCSDRLLAITTVAFDISILEMLMPLTLGAQVVVALEEELGDPESIARLIDACEITACQATPGFWRKLIASSWTGREGLKIYCGGEALASDLAAQLLARKCQLWNLYGPTEATIWSTVCKVQDAGNSPVVSLGMALPESVAVVLDEYRRPCPEFVPGELYLLGPHLATGYRDNPELTAERFPVIAWQGLLKRAYRTGDRAVLGGDGQIDFLGRTDWQLKIRGFRVETGEVEHALRTLPEITDAAVVLDKNGGNAQLKAFYEGVQSVGRAELLERLRAIIPVYMIPTEFTFLEALPRNTNGKIDRKLLQKMAISVTSDAERFGLSLQPLHQQAAAIWSQTLGHTEAALTQDFFLSGGNSLVAVELLASIAVETGITVPLRSFLRNPTLSGLCRSMSEIEKTSPQESGIPRCFRQPKHELSSSQRRFWFLNAWSPDSPSYHVLMAVRIRGALDPELLQQSVCRVIQNHEILRTCFPFDTSTVGPIATVVPELNWEFDQHDLTATAESGRTELSHRIIRKLVNRPFDLATCPLIRGCLIHCLPNEWVVAFVAPHILVDEWSMGILLHEAAAVYASRMQSNASDSSAPTASRRQILQYLDYVRWQQSPENASVKAEHMRYWVDKLRGRSSILNLPCDKPRPPVTHHQGRRFKATLPIGLMKSIDQLAQAESTTRFSVILAAYFLWLYKATGQQSINIGVPVSARKRADLSNVVGPLINTLVMACDIEPDDTNAQLVRKVDQLADEANQHDGAAIEELVEELKLPRDPAINPLFQVMFVLHQYPTRRAEVHTLSIDLEPVETYTSKFDLTLEVVPPNFDDQNWSVVWEYNSEIFEAQTISRFANQFEHILQLIVKQQHSRIMDLEIVVPRDALIGCSNARVGKRDSEFAQPDVLEMFVRAVDSHPAVNAIWTPNACLSYARLDELSRDFAERLAQELRSSASPVAVLLGRTLSMPVALLSVMRSGAPVLVLDASLPDDRLRLMLSQASVQAIVTDPALSSRAQQLLEGKRVSQFEFATADFHLVTWHLSQNKCTSSQREGTEPRALPGRSSHEKPAYLVFTSGSTGVPKSVAVHQGLLGNLTNWQTNRSCVGASGRTLQFASLGFDVLFQEVFSTLCSGGTLCLLDDSTKLDLSAVAERISSWRIDRLFCTPHALHAFAIWFNHSGHYPEELKEVYVAGDRLLVTPEIRTLFTEISGCQLENQYGPSETHVATSYRLPPDVSDWPSEVPIGQPIDGGSIYILDERLHPVLPGAIGEICITGELLGNGYFGSFDLTEDRFVENPWRSKGNDYLYVTGDLGRVNIASQIEFIGRKDRQVKIDGYRTEPVEVETALMSLSSIRQAAVVAKVRSNRSVDLIAFAQPIAGAWPSQAELRTQLESMLPHYMVPREIRVVTSIPTTSNGKVDRLKLLEECETNAQPAAQTTVSVEEATIIKIWRDLLVKSDFGLDDSFFELGGNSILAVQFVVTLREQYRCSLTVPLFFQHPTVRATARYLDGPRSESQVCEQIDWVKEASLSRPIELVGVHTHTCKSVLLTGATGFLGGFLVDELLSQTDLNIVCLVRGKQHELAKRRLVTQLKDLKLDETTLERRVSIFSGDLEQTDFGRTSKALDELARNVDGIFHCGAIVNSLSSYSMLRMSNVLAVEQFIHLAARAGGVPLHFVSTTGVLPMPNAGRVPLSELSSRLPSECRNLPDDAYSQSKWVAEQLIMEAYRQGLPTSIYRPGRLTMHTSKRIINQRDFLSIFLPVCHVLGAIPDIAAHVDITPVDFAARELVRLSLSPDSIGKIHVLANPRPPHLWEITDLLRQAGHEWECIPLEQWRERLLAQEDAESLPMLRILKHALNEDADLQQFDLAILRALQARCRWEEEKGDISFPVIDGAYLVSFLTAILNGGQSAALLIEQQS